MKKNLRLFLVALLCFAPLWYVAPVWASDSDFEVENEDGVELWYHWLDGENGKYVEVCGPNGDSGMDCGILNIPSEVYSDGFDRTYTVVGVGDYAFVNIYNLVSLTIPNTVTYIGSEAFSLCQQLPSVVFPESITSIGSGAFHQCSNLAEITLNEGLKSIGEDAFNDCAITSIYIPGTVTDFGPSSFNNLRIQLASANLRTKF